MALESWDDSSSEKLSIFDIFLKRAQYVYYNVLESFQRLSRLFLGLQRISLQVK